MIGKITSEMISRRWALSLLGALGFVAAPTVLRPSNAKAQTAAAAPGRRKVALALQGGGSHGAFTWGVLDQLLDDTTIDIVGVTGTSAGAMNGAVLVDGLVRGGPNKRALSFDDTGRESEQCQGSVASFRTCPGRRLPERLSKAFLLTSRP